MTFLYVLTRYLTFPGVYVRCMWEQAVCRITKTVVEDNRYIRDDEMCSHIDHELMGSPTGALAIGLVPCFFNAVGVVFLSVFPFIFRPSSLAGTVFSFLAVWFVLSLASNCFPQIEDALNMMTKIYKEGNLLQKIVFAPFAAVLFVGAYLERYCVTFIAAAGGIVIAFIL